ncbi:zinc ribbon domain-containing protein [Pectinatus cerevisiiphilus]|uniref:Zinc ribbon protein n=1 Tax=Pectinatus cerevisiiphilus TaxID=86956 RepID=A0A4R3K4L2_9FIRM|nr:zinc ribbon domain-containing protein [Pectinatus cerevisiiphilus]TCS77601.1 hypothetical protein EDC37_1142 [Pectinatus cerevisiiphilus]
MNCPKCNSVLEKKSKFCPECGFDLTNVTFEDNIPNNSTDSSSSPSTPTTSSTTSTGTPRKTLYIIGIVIFVAFLFLLYGPGSSTKHNSTTSDFEPKTHVTEKKPPADSSDPVSLNTPFSKPGIAEITIKGTEFTDKVIPTNPSGYYSYYQADEGKVYFVINATLKNLKKEKEDMDKLVRIDAVYSDGYKYHCMLLRDRNGRLDGLYEFIDPLQPENVKIAVQLPAEAATNTLPIKVVFDFSTQKNVFTFR